MQAGEGQHVGRGERDIEAVAPPAIRQRRRPDGTHRQRHRRPEWRVRPHRLNRDGRHGDDGQDNGEAHHPAEAVSDGDHVFSGIFGPGREDREARIRREGEVPEARIGRGRAVGAAELPLIPEQRQPRGRDVKVRRVTFQHRLIPRLRNHHRRDRPGPQAQVRRRTGHRPERVARGDGIGARVRGLRRGNVEEIVRRPRNIRPFVLPLIGDRSDARRQRDKRHRLARTRGHVLRLLREVRQSGLIRITHAQAVHNRQPARRSIHPEDMPVDRVGQPRVGHPHRRHQARRRVGLHRRTTARQRRILAEIVDVVVVGAVGERDDRHGLRAKTKGHVHVQIREGHRVGAAPIGEINVIRIEEGKGVRRIGREQMGIQIKRLLPPVQDEPHPIHGTQHRRDREIQHVGLPRRHGHLGEECRVTRRAARQRQRHARRQIRDRELAQKIRRHHLPGDGHLHPRHHLHRIARRIGDAPDQRARGRRRFAWHQRHPRLRLAVEHAEGPARQNRSVRLHQQRRQRRVGPRAGGERRFIGAAGRQPRDVAPRQSLHAAELPPDQDLAVQLHRHRGHLIIRTDPRIKGHVHRPGDIQPRDPAARKYPHVPEGPAQHDLPVQLQCQGRHHAIRPRARIKRRVQRAVRMQPRHPRPVRGVVALERPANEHLAIRLQRHRPHRSVRADPAQKAQVHAPVRIQLGHAAAQIAVHQNEIPRDVRRAVIQGHHRIHRAIRPERRIKRQVHGPVRIQPRHPRPRQAGHVGETAADRHLAIALDKHRMHRAIRSQG